MKYHTVEELSTVQAIIHSQRTVNAANMTSTVIVTGKTNKQGRVDGTTYIPNHIPTRGETSNLSSDNFSLPRVTNAIANQRCVAYPSHTLSHRNCVVQKFLSRLIDSISHHEQRSTNGNHNRPSWGRNFPVHCSQLHYQHSITQVSNGPHLLLNSNNIFCHLFRVFSEFWEKS